jgi:cholesterol transport system auxiliary component
MSARLVPRRKLLFVGPLLTLSSGCSVLPTPPTAQIYRLSPQLNDPQGRSIPNGKLIVDRPTTSESLDTNRIALMQGNLRFDYYADSVWTDRLPVLLQNLMIESFEANGRIAQVSPNVYSFSDGYLLQTEIRRFEAQYADPATSPPEIAVVLDLQLSSNPEGRLVGNKLISVQAHAAQNKVDAVVIAFDSATGDALAQSVAWTVGTIYRDHTQSLHRGNTVDGRSSKE